MIVSEVVALLNAIQPPVFRAILGAAELSLVKDKLPASPIAYVLIKDEASDANQRMGSVLQVTQCDFAVLIGVTNVTDATGAAAIASLEPIKSAVRQALLGKTLAGADDVTTHVSGTLVRAANGTLLWEETFATSYLLEA